MFARIFVLGKMKNIPVPIVAIDFEGSRKLGIVEFGAAEFFGGELVRAHTGICRPNAEISAADSALFNISNAQASAQKPFSESLPLFIALRQRGVFAAHNASVEDSFLRAQAPTPSEVPDFIRGGTCISWAPWLDSCIFFRNLYPSLNAKLSEAVASLGLLSELDSLAEKFCPEGRRKWHCALFDAIACGLIYTKICSFEGFEDVTLEWLAKYSGNLDADQKNLGGIL